MVISGRILSQVKHIMESKGTRKTMHRSEVLPAGSFASHFKGSLGNRKKHI